MNKMTIQDNLSSVSANYGGLMCTGGRRYVKHNWGSGRADAALYAGHYINRAILLGYPRLTYQHNPAGGLFLIYKDAVEANIHHFYTKRQVTHIQRHAACKTLAARNIGDNGGVSTWTEI